MSRELKLRMILEMGQKLTGPMREIVAGSKGMTAALKLSTEELAKLKRSQTNLSAFREMKTMLVTTKREADTASKRLAALAKTISETEKPSAKLTREFARAQRELATLSERHQKQNRLLKDLGKGLSEAGLGTTNLSTHEQKLAAQIAKTSSAIDKQGSKLERLAARRKAVNSIKEGAGVVGLGASLLVTAPLVGFAITSVRAAREASAAMAQTRASIASMGDQAGRTFPQLQAQATKLMKTSLFDDDQILGGVTANLLTFGKVSGDVFDRAQQATIDLASKMGGDLQGRAIMVGKALNDPIKGISSLTRVGVSFTEQQKKMVKAMVATGNTAGAQNLILAELEKQYGGSGKAARKADPTGAAAIDLGEFQQTIGEKLLPKIVPLVEMLSGLLDKFNALSPATQNTIVSMVGLAAIFGPVATGISSVIGLAGGAATGISWLSTKLKTVGKAAEAAEGLESVGSKALRLGKSALTASGKWTKMAAGMAVDKLSDAGTALLSVGKSALTMGRNALIGLWAYVRMAAGMAIGGLQAVGTALLSVGRAALIMGRAFLLNPVTLIITAIAVGAYLIYTYWDQIVPFFTKLWADAKAIFFAAWEGIKQFFFTYTPASLIYSNWSGIGAWFDGLWKNVTNIFWGSLEAIKIVFLNYHPVGLIYTHWSGITAWFAGLWGKVRGVFSGAWSGIKGMMSGWGASMWAVGSNIVSGLVAGIKAAPGAVWEALKGIVFGGLSRVKEFLGIGGKASPIRSGALPVLTAGRKIAGARALGGPVSRGLTYLVGENGPEYFTAPVGGKVIPNNKIGAFRDQFAGLAERSRGLGRAVVTGGGIVGLAASPAYAAAPSAPSARSGGDKIEITFNNATRADIPDIEAAILRLFERRDRERGALRRSSFRDDV